MALQQIHLVSQDLNTEQMMAECLRLLFSHSFIFLMQKHNHFGGFKMFFFEVTSGIVVIDHISAVSGV